MFDANFNIIQGYRSSGRSSLLFLIASILKSGNNTLIFLGATDEFNNLEYTWAKSNFFEYKFFYRHRDHKLIQNIVEISNRNKIDYILVDDIEFLSEIDIKNLESSKSKKIGTCLIDKIPIFMSEYTDFTVSYQEEYSVIPTNVQKISINSDDPIKLEEFLKILEREQKIISIINEK